jgi:16S rRNA processing protein RimM
LFSTLRNEVLLSKNKIIIGRFGSPFGIKGWLRVISFTDPATNIVNLSPWFVKQGAEYKEVLVEEWQLHGQAVLLKLQNISDREQAKAYTNLDIVIERAQLPELPANEYYWVDLVGLNVIDTNGVNLGVVDSLIATGSNDVLVVKNHDKHKKHLIPYTKKVVVLVDLVNKLLKVAWNEHAI